MTKPNEPTSANAPIASAPPMAARRVPDGPSFAAGPERRERDAQERMRIGRHGRHVHVFLAPNQKKTVAMNIIAPGMPNATAGPYLRRKIGMSSEAKNDPKLMIQ